MRTCRKLGQEAAVVADATTKLAVHGQVSRRGRKRQMHYLQTSLLSAVISLHHLIVLLARLHSILPLIWAVWTQKRY